MEQPPEPPGPYGGQPYFPQPGNPPPPMPPAGGPPYGGQPYYPPPAAAPTNTLAIIALVGAFVFAPAGLICGIIARRQIQQTGEAGAGLALAAIEVSAITIALGVLVIGGLIIGLAMVGTAVSHLPTPAPSDVFPSPFPTS